MVIDMNMVYALADKVKRECPTADVEIIGCWVWVSFPGIPSPAIREMLKSERFHWNRSRQCWQFAGKPSGRSRAARAYIAEKYGAQTVEETVEAA